MKLSPRTLVAHSMLNDLVVQWQETPRARPTIRKIGVHQARAEDARNARKQVTSSLALVPKIKRYYLFIFIDFNVPIPVVRWSQSTYQRTCIHVFVSFPFEIFPSLCEATKKWTNGGACEGYLPSTSKKKKQMTAGRIRLENECRCRRLQSLGVPGRARHTGMLRIRHKSMEGYQNHPTNVAAAC